MSGGEWLIRQRAPGDRFTTERVTVEPAASGKGEPDFRPNDVAMEFWYADGRELIFPWHNILRAEYRPHTEP